MQRQTLPVHGPVGVAVYLGASEARRDDLVPHMDTDAKGIVASIYMLEPFFASRSMTLFLLLMGAVILGGAALAAWLAPAMAALSPAAMAWITSISASLAVAAAFEPVMQAGRMTEAAVRRLGADVAEARTDRDLRIAGQRLGEALAQALLVAGPALADLYGAGRLITLPPHPPVPRTPAAGRRGTSSATPEHSGSGQPVPEPMPLMTRIRGRERVIEQWRREGTTLVKVWPARVTPEMRAVGAGVTPEPATFSTGSEAYRQYGTATGYVTEERFVRGRSAEEIAEMMGIGAPYRAGDFGIEIARLQRLPEIDEFHVASPGGYTTVPAREPIGSQPHAPGSPESQLWPPGTGAPQFKLDTPIPVDPPLHLLPGQRF